MELISQDAERIECKKNDYNSTVSKNKAWEDALMKFHGRYGQSREMKGLKDQWKRMKILAKKEWATFKRETSKTGGGQVPVEAKKH